MKTDKMNAIKIENFLERHCEEGERTFLKM
jgi:hypothetical protein